MNSPDVAERYPNLTNAGVEIQDACIGCTNMERLERHAGIAAIDGSSMEEIAARHISLNCFKGVIEPIPGSGLSQTNCASRARPQA